MSLAAASDQKTGNFKMEFARRHMPTSSNQRSLQLVGVTAALRLHFASTRRLFRPDASANLDSVYQRCESTRDCFCHACNAPADVLQQVSQMNLGIQPRYCKHADGQKPAAEKTSTAHGHTMNKTPHLMTVLHVATEMKKSLESDDSATPR